MNEENAANPSPANNFLDEKLFKSRSISIYAAKIEHARLRLKGLSKMITCEMHRDIFDKFQSAD